MSPSPPHAVFALDHDLRALAASLVVGVPI